jgi:TolB-like protein/predicted metal-dependent HD superfamily phosphohydrolase/Tfp pilus assembly protein PilF
MPSVIAGFEYDIFISYRHRDNRVAAPGFHGSAGSGWVTSFVEDLSRELQSTYKEDLSIYFDSNPVDGLLETHDVDKSLEGKLKSVILIPVLSQIYCDSRSYAWQNEFCAFNRAAQKDAIGRDIKLRNGNVASRILPVVISQLDAEDRELVEGELSTKLRPIDFIFKSPGVNRPLRPEDKRQDSTNNLLYADQINKVANAIKEIIQSIKNPGRAPEVPVGAAEADSADDSRQQPNISEKSLAVLPFVSLSQDPSQEYFSDGITENIMIQLSSNPDLRVISRTSVMRYKKTTKTAPEIANELGVKYILEGSAQAHGNKVRINVQLINALRDQPIWSKVFVESMVDIFEIQGNVAEVVARELHSTITPQQNEKLKEIPTRNLEAYDLFLKGRHAFNQWSVDGYRTATEYFLKAASLDPEFHEAYSYLASSYSARMSWNGDLSPLESKKHIDQYLTSAWQRGPSDIDYQTRGFAEFFIEKNFAEAERNFLKAIEMAPNNAGSLYAYTYLLNMMGRITEATKWLEKARSIDPLTVAYYNYRFISLYLSGAIDAAIQVLNEALHLYPNVIRLYDFAGRAYLTQGNFEQAAQVISSGLATSRLRPPSMLAYQAAAYARLGLNEKADKLVQELVARSEAGEKGVNIYLVQVAWALGDEEQARQWLAKARSTNDIDLIWWEVDPLLADFRELERNVNRAPDVNGAITAIQQRLREQMPELPYHNWVHVEDVVQAVEKIGSFEQLPAAELDLVRVAAWLHDIGFIQGARNHEETGAEIARQLLPAFRFAPEQVSAVENMILATRIPQTPTTVLEKVLCDADLDYLGRDDFYEVGSRLYRELLDHGVVETEREWNLVQKTFLESHRYHTKFGRLNREEQKRNRLQEIVAKLRAR